MLLRLAAFVCSCSTHFVYFSNTADCHSLLSTNLTIMCLDAIVGNRTDMVQCSLSQSVTFRTARSSSPFAGATVECKCNQAARPAEFITLTACLRVALVFSSRCHRGLSLRTLCSQTYCDRCFVVAVGTSWNGRLRLMSPRQEPNRAAQQPHIPFRVES